MEWNIRYELEYDKTTDSDFPFPQFDLFDWYLQLGSLKNVNEKYFHNKIPTWNNFVQHPNYDAFWQKNSPLNYVPIPQMPQLACRRLLRPGRFERPAADVCAHGKERQLSTATILYWAHGTMGNGRREKADSLGKISFGSNTAVWFQALQQKWFDYYLKGNGDGKFDEAIVFKPAATNGKHTTLAAERGDH